MSSELLSSIPSETAAPAIPAVHSGTSPRASELAVEIREISKSYHITHQGSRATSLTEVVMNRIRRPLGNSTGETFWALDDISFSIAKGEVVGIIGRNGAGKSTLLKILSRVTEPTTGQIDLYGRVGSLLEVGTGFHPDLTGRENIYLNGTILGMTRKEIDRQFDAIVDFSEIEKFLDTPVKRYSSGMYVRLAFAVAAHLNPEILIIDEVLAVGDLQFQKKCLGKIGDVSKNGRTVLFVSHNMGAVAQLCSRAVLLEKGKVKMSGETGTVIAEFLSAGASDSGTVDLAAHELRRGTGAVKFMKAAIRNAQGELCTAFQIGDDILIDFEFQCRESLRAVKLAAEMFTGDGMKIANMVDVDSHFAMSNPKQREKVTLRIKDIRLYPGSYLLGFWAGSVDSASTYDWVENCLQFEIVGGGMLASRELPRSSGLLFMTPQWHQHVAGE